MRRVFSGKQPISSAGSLIEASYNLLFLEAKWSRWNVCGKKKSEVDLCIWRELNEVIRIRQKRFFVEKNTRKV